MTDLDKLRSALHEAPEQPFAAPDLGRIFTEGRRIRRRRRIVTGAGAVVGVVAVVGIVFGAVALRTPAEPVPVAAAPHGPASASTEAPPPSSTAPPTAVDQLPKSMIQPYGDVIPSGIDTTTGRVVFYATKIDDSPLPDVHFGLMAALQTKTGFQPLYASNEIRGSDRSFGFHATAGGLTTADTWVPVFGYFAGPAVKITSTVHGKPVVAQTAQWSVDPNVVVFWFNPKEVPSSAVLTPLVAYGKDGTRLTK
ncbi:hypothetical protein VSH64_38125 [Amycolatopsis rhabdoformis]|uniref:Uncharacterized protein n=1 Tax=Amycolatopsis rhabdoformis TaxID=1448059 RepID=A0ABZ1I2L1_9PSEU|nr:hypothetical protein [Amycolatopsis rhabdoformis]WSE28603.1 hypothetical protein VSH64_38125 [Amycolatopsis rhabdoformis]